MRGKELKNAICGRMMTEDSHNADVIKVMVHNSPNSEWMKMKTMLEHEEFPYLDEQQVGTMTDITRHANHIPVLFEANDLRISKESIHKLLPVDQSFTSDFKSVFSNTTPSDKNTQGHIVFHQDNIDLGESVIQNQREYASDSLYRGGSCVNSTIDKLAGNEKEHAQSENKRCTTLDTVDRDSLEAISWPFPINTAKKEEKPEIQAQKHVIENAHDDEYDDTSEAELQEVKKIETVEHDGVCNSVEGNKDDKMVSKQTLKTIDIREKTEITNSKDSNELSATDSTMLVAKRNSTYCGRKKAPDYRPGTSLDNFRHSNTQKVNNIQKDLDPNEGEKIWKDMDAMIKRSIPNGSLWKLKKESSLSSNKGSDKSKQTIEFRPRFERTGAEASHFVPVDHMWTIELEPDYLENDIVIPVDKETTFDRVYGKQSEGTEYEYPAQQDRKQQGGNYLSETDGEIFENENINSECGKKKGCETNVGKLKTEIRRQDQRRTVTIMEDEKTMKHGHTAFLKSPVGCDYLKIHLINKTSSAPTPSIHISPSGACKSRAMMMASSLPRLTPSSTPLPTGITQPPPRAHSSASLYVPYPPKDLSSSIDYMKMPQRINPLKPPPPRRRINWSWETVDQHHENEKRRLLMQKREHTRYHSAWAKAFYGAPAEKEAYRRHYREVLKQQMDDRDSMRKDDFQNKVKESERALAYDRQCQVNDSNEFFRKHNYLMQFRDGNKQQMEDRWAQVRYSKHVEDRVDRERLRYNPINWSCSLK